ncbi:hypothetical protein FRC03_009115 [Tulasnella sp. 419]|nr:hypothetical protein FRC02_009038 [Tulasnella sp. 418]KAG8958447.1 hypothetical protein FRC03_009115 [Tulasnella sp. 419]
MAELGEISTLPALERFSSSMGLHGATTLGKGVRMDGLSYGRRRGIVGKPEHVPAVPPTIKRVSEAASESPVQPRKELSMVSTVRVTPRINQKPRLVVRSGREDWGRKVE